MERKLGRSLTSDSRTIYGNVNSLLVFDDNSWMDPVVDTNQRSKVRITNNHSSYKVYIGISDYDTNVSLSDTQFMYRILPEETIDIELCQDYRIWARNSSGLSLSSNISAIEIY